MTSAELAVGLDHQRHARRLDRDLDQVEADLVEVGDLLLRRLDHRLGRDRRRASSYSAGSSEPPLTPMRIGTWRSRASVGHGLDVLGLADVAGVEAQALHAGLHRRQRHPVLVVDVGDDRHRRAGHDLGQPLGGLGLVARATDDVAAGRGQGVDLLQRALDVGRLGDRHRLHA